MSEALDLAEWIIKNRKGEAFKNYDMARLCKEIVECATNDTMLCVEDENKNIVGVYFGEVNHDTKVFFIHDILATSTFVLKEMLKYFIKK